MSGHSKWSTIKHQKASADQKRGQLFSKLSRLIAITARNGADPESNFKLRLAIEKAKSVNMPKDNIQRAIDKGSGRGEKGQLDEITYEGFGPGQVAFLVEIITDNKNRTLSEIRGIFERAGGRLAETGAAGYLFKQAGWLVLEKPKDVQSAILQIIDLNVENVEEIPEGIEVVTKPGELEKIAGELAKQGFAVKEKELIRLPKTNLPVDSQVEEKVRKLIRVLEDHDDVQKIFTNLNHSE